MVLSKHSSQPDYSENSSSERKEDHDTRERQKSYFKILDSEDFGEIYDTKKLFLGVQRHLFLIVGSMLAFGLLGAYATYMFQNTYEAEALVIYQEEEQASKDIEGGYTLTNLSLPTVLDMIQMPKHYEAVKAMLGLDLKPGEIKAMMYVPKPKNDSNLIRIVAKTNNSNLSIDLANALAKVAVKSSQEFTKKQIKMALESYEQQLQIVRDTTASQIDSMEKFKLENQYFDMKPEESSVLTKVEEARKLKDQAVLEYNSLRAQYENLKTEIENVPKYVPISMESKDSPLQTRIASLEATLAEAKAKYTKDNPKLLQLEEEINELHRRSKHDRLSDSEPKFYEKNTLREKLEIELLQLQSKAKSAQKVSEEVSRNFNQLEKELDILPTHQMAFVKLLQSNEVSKEQLKEMNKAVDAAKLMLNVPKGSIELYQLAKDAKPWKDSLWVDFIPILGLIFGLGVGIAGSVFLEVRDNKIRTSKQIEMYYTVPCIGSIPELSGIKPSTAQRKFLFFIRNFVDYLDKALKRKNGKSNAVIAIASSISKEGKSLISGLTAEYYSKIEKKTLLLEMDYKDSPLRKLSEVHSPSITDYLRGNATIDEIIILGDYDRISLAKREPGMKELLKTKAAGQLWRYLRSKYDLVIIDTPGVIEEDYAINLSEISDLTVLIVGSSNVDKSTVDETLRVLEFSESKLGGILLNRINSVYVTDKRVKLETKRSRTTLLSNFRSRDRGTKDKDKA